MANPLHCIAISLGLLAASTVPAQADPRATARLVSCGEQDCLLLRGHREAVDASVTVNGRPVETRGRHGWQARVPVAMLRDWSAPFARKVQVEIVDATGAIERSDSVRLPVGLLGHQVELASLVVRAR